MPRWTEEETQMLKEAWPLLGYKCAYMFPHFTLHAVQAKAFREGWASPHRVGRAKNPGKPKPEKKKRDPGLSGKIARFFEANPDELLTPSDIVAKFGVSPKTVECRLTLLKKSGLVEVVRVVRPKRVAMKEAA